MKSTVRLFIFLITLCFLNECNSYDFVNAIPKEDRYVYEEGDSLIYKCSDGQNSTFFVKVVSRVFLPIFSYTQEYQTIVIESINDRWYKYLNWPSWLTPTPCYKTYVDSWTGGGHEDARPKVNVSSGCGGFYESSRIGYGWEVDFEDTTFNNKQYYKVYFDTKENSPNKDSVYDIYWNLKYGIIRFVGYSEFDTLYWDLEGTL